MEDGEKLHSTTVCSPSCDSVTSLHSHQNSHFVQFTCQKCQQLGGFFFSNLILNFFWVGGSCWDVRTLFVRTDFYTRCICQCGSQRRPQLVTRSMLRCKRSDICADDDGSVAYFCYCIVFFACSSDSRRGDPATSSVELGTSRRAQHAGHARPAELPSPMNCHRSMRRRRCTRYFINALSDRTA